MLKKVRKMGTNLPTSVVQGTVFLTNLGGLSFRLFEAHGSQLRPIYCCQNADNFLICAIYMVFMWDLLNFCRIFTTFGPYLFTGLCLENAREFRANLV